MRASRSWEVALGTERGARRETGDRDWLGECGMQVCRSGGDGHSRLLGKESWVCFGACRATGPVGLRLLRVQLPEGSTALPAPREASPKSPGHGILEPHNGPLYALVCISTMPSPLSRSLAPAKPICSLAPVYGHFPQWPYLCSSCSLYPEGPFLYPYHPNLSRPRANRTIQEALPIGLATSTGSPPDGT